MAKKGRRNKPADRGDERAPAMWGRVVQIGEEMEALRVSEDTIRDARLATMLYRLKLYGAISELEYQTGCIVAEIYGLHDRLVTGAKRHVASPSYMRGWGKGELDIERMDADDVKAMERRARRARNRWNRVQSCLADPERAVVEDVCVFDRAAPASQSDLLSDALTVIATELNVFAQAKARARAAPRQGTKPASRRPPSIPKELRAGNPAPRMSREKVAFIATMRHARPDMDAEALEQAWRIKEAMKDRDRFRDDKERARATAS